MTTWRVIAGDCTELLRGWQAASLGACVTDPPYGLGFMNKRWDVRDNVAFRYETWQEVYRVLKPGGEL